MFPMSMLALNMMVMGILMLCVIRLFWSETLNAPVLSSSPKSKTILINYSHLW